MSMKPSVHLLHSPFSVPLPLSLITSSPPLQEEEGGQGKREGDFLSHQRLEEKKEIVRDRHAD